MKKTIIYSLILAALPMAAVAQEDAAEVEVVRVPRTRVTVPTFPVKGRVLDAATRQPVSGISIQAYNNSQFAAMTDEDGTFTIHIPDFVTSLVFTAPDYQLIQQSLGNVSASAENNMGDVLIYSDRFPSIYSKTTKATAGRTTNVNYNTNDISIDQQLQSALGGEMRTLLRSAAPGQGVAMFMNGLNSLNANAQPLVVVDGVIQNMQRDASSLHDGFFNNILANIMVEDIEKVSVLRNGTAIYGAKGANGVVIIETKRNKSMATKIDVSVGGSYELVPRLPEVMNSQQYRVYASELLGTTGTQNNSFKFLQNDPTYYYYNKYHNQTDWSKKVYKNAFTQNYSINVQGGDEVANYNLSVGYAGSDATLVDNDFSRFNLRLNSDILLLDNLHVRFDASYSDVTRDLRDDGVKADVRDGIISSPSFLSLIKSPFLSPYAIDSYGRPSSYLAEADDYLSDVVTTKGVTTSLANPLSILQNGEGTNKNYFGNRSVNLAITPKWDITKDWTVAEHFAFQLMNTDENYYLPTNGVPQYEVEGLGKVQNVVSALAGRQITLMSDAYAEYHHRFDAHLLNVRGGFRYLRDSFRQNIQVGYDTGNDKTPNMTGNLNNKKTDGFDNIDVDLTYYLTADYNYLERYYLSAGISMDGSSKFGVDAKEGVRIGNYAFGFFPSVEAGWVMTNERWFRPNRGLNYLRLSAGYDISGNDDISSIASRTYFVAGKMFANTTGKTIGNIGNTTLQWETTYRFTAGLQLAAFNNRLSAQFNYFRSTTDNLLALTALSYLTGLESNWTNDGALRNEGFDVHADIKLVNTKDWKWSLGGSMGHYVNKLTALPGGKQEMQTELYGATVLSRVGESAGVFYGYRTQGVFASADEAAAANLYQLTNTGAQQYFKAGDVHFVDVDGNGRIDSNDRQIIGNPNPDIYGNIQTQLSWKNLTLNVGFNYSLGGDIYNYQRSILEGGSYFYNQTTAMLNRWTHEGQQTDVPRASFLDEMGNSRFSDRWIEDGSYLKLKNVTLSYYIPIRNEFLHGLTIWAAGNNLWTVTRYLGGDPEFAQGNTVLGQGIDRGLLGTGRSVSVGAKINL